MQCSRLESLDYAASLATFISQLLYTICMHVSDFGPIESIFFLVWLSKSWTALAHSVLRPHVHKNVSRLHIRLRKMITSWPIKSCTELFWSVLKGQAYQTNPIHLLFHSTDEICNHCLSDDVDKYYYIYFLRLELIFSVVHFSLLHSSLLLFIFCPI